MGIIQDDYIDEEEARNFLQNLYDGVELLPGVSEELTAQEAASVLNVSIPTVERMVSDRMLKLTKTDLIETVMNNMLAEKPVEEEEETEMYKPGRELTPEEKTVHQKAFSDVEKCIKDLEDQQSLFSDEDLKQE